MNNQLYNCKNPYQGAAKKVLCVCSAGLLRSPTTAVVLAEKYGYNTRACGVDIGHALIPISDALLYWADEIVCMDKDQHLSVRMLMDVFEAQREGMLDGQIHDTPVHVLGIPDRYGYMETELKEMIIRNYGELNE